MARYFVLIMRILLKVISHLETTKILKIIANQLLRFLCILYAFKFGTFDLTDNQKYYTNN